MVDSRTPVSVLHVDDDQSFAELTSDFLERQADHLAVDAETGAEAALERLSAEQYDCVVSDLEMPGRDGLELLKIVRDRYGDLPFILFTGKGSEEVAAEAIAAGVTDYLQKSGETDTYVVLANRIENAVSQHRAQSEVAEQSRRLSILREVNQWLVQSETRESIERGLIERLESAEGYIAAWIGEYDADHDRVVPRAVGDRLAGQCSPTALDTAADPQPLVLDAIEEEAIVVDAAGDQSVDVWHSAGDLPYGSVAVVPISYHGTLLGVLAIFADTTDQFTEPERGMLTEIAGDVGQALHMAAVLDRLKEHRTAVENVPEGVFLLDDNGYIDLVNPAAAALVDESPEDLEGTAFPTYVDRGVFDQSVIDWYLEAIRDLLSSSTASTTARYHTAIEPVGDESKDVEIRLTLRPFEDDFRGSVGIIRQTETLAPREESAPESFAGN